MGDIIGTFNHEDHYCPVCGGNKARAMSEQIGECVGEMWISCGDCGWSGNESNRVETTGGWNSTLTNFAFDEWVNNVLEYKGLPPRDFYKRS